MGTRHSHPSRIKLRASESNFSTVVDARLDLYHHLSDLKQEVSSLKEECRTLRLTRAETEEEEVLLAAMIERKMRELDERQGELEEIATVIARGCE